jgi:hypothetical protein
MEKPMILHGMQSFGAGSALVKRKRFDSFAIKDCPGSVFIFLCCVTVGSPLPKDDFLPKKINVELLTSPFIIAKQLDLGDNQFFCPVRKYAVFRDYYKYTQYTDVGKLVAISFRSVESIVNLYKDPDCVHDNMYYRFNIV